LWEKNSYTASLLLKGYLVVLQCLLYLRFPAKYSNHSILISSLIQITVAVAAKKPQEFYLYVYAHRGLQIHSRSTNAVPDGTVRVPIFFTFRKYLYLGQVLVDRQTL
jgi:hypothetical protein